MGLSYALQQQFCGESGMSCVICARLYATYEKCSRHIQWAMPRHVGCRSGKPSYLLKRQRHSIPQRPASLHRDGSVTINHRRAPDGTVDGARSRPLPCRSMTGNCICWPRWPMNRAMRNQYRRRRASGALKMALVGSLPRKAVKIITRARRSAIARTKGRFITTYQWWIGACNELVTENRARYQNAGAQILRRTR